MRLLVVLSTLASAAIVFADPGQVRVRVDYTPPPTPIVRYIAVPQSPPPLPVVYTVPARVEYFPAVQMPVYFVPVAQQPKKFPTPIRDFFFGR